MRSHKPGRTMLLILVAIVWALMALVPLPVHGDDRPQGTDGVDDAPGLGAARNANAGQFRAMSSASASSNSSPTA